MNLERLADRKYWYTGAVLMVLSLTGAAWALRDSLSGNPVPSSALGDESAVVWCEGLVDVEYGVRELRSGQPGRVTEVLVQDNDEVKAGTVLLRMEDTEARLQVRRAEANLEAAQRQLAAARTLPQRHQHQVAAQQQVLAGLQHRLSASRHQFKRKQDLQKLGHANPDELDALAEEVKAQEALERVEQEKLRVLELTDATTAGALAELHVREKEASREQARHALQECELRAPGDGTVLRVLVGPGVSLGLAPSQPVLHFCPAQPRLIRAEVEQEFAGRVALGQTARIQDESCPGATWRGRVIRISGWFAPRRSVLQEPLRINDVRTLECIIAPEPNQPPLRIGQRVRMTLGPKGSLPNAE